MSVPGPDIERLVQTRRTATLRYLQDLTKLQRAASDEAGGSNELAWLLALDNLVFATEAEVRWLNHVESRLARARTRIHEAHTRDTTLPAAQRSTKGASR